MDRILKDKTGKFVSHPIPNLCTIEGCGSKVMGHGFCNKHWLRWKRYGDPLFFKKAANGEGKSFIGNHGYRVLIIDGKRVLEHRYVAEQMLGRRLKSSEIVHHKDGIKLNNDPANLIVTFRSDHVKQHPEVLSHLSLGPKHRRRTSH